MQRPCVYHLFGKVAASPSYVISDEDMLEFICALQSEHLTPEKLFHELEHSHLLFIGSNFSNWLARLFLRDAPLLLLDEPTANLDGATEEEVLVAVRRLIAGRTTIVVAHRPALVALADRVVDLGRVAVPA